MPSVPRYSVDDVEDKDWVVFVQSSWKPAVVGRFVLRFPWHGDGDVLEAVEATYGGDDGGGEGGGAVSGNVEDYVQLQLEGGIAFGTGEHPTTQLCLEWICDTLPSLTTTIATTDDDDDDDDAEQEAPLFLDYGSGSGVLGLAACAISPDNAAHNNLRSIGIDIDPDAVRIASYNARVNGLAMKSYLPPSTIDDDDGDDYESASVLMKAVYRTDTERLPEGLDGCLYDACAANILAGPLRMLVGRIAGMVRVGGKIGLRLVCCCCVPNSATGQRRTRRWVGVT